ncbi:MAG TPA: GNAT family N-acetyltransferase [Anaeromyxobacteraceae bacterium]|nr:GNAT family N-acetyltransferase [Anaeromyxobacteraceae bacterium]
MVTVRAQSEATAMEPTHRYRMRLARADELLRLRAIEDEAGTLFDGLGVFEASLDASFPLDALAKLIDLRQVWVACLDDDFPVGMVIASARDGVAYVEELDVVPAHGRRGLGTRLLEEVYAWAEARGYAAVTLSTFRDLAWNAPFYRKRGFRDLEPAEWSPGMKAISEDESKRGLRVDLRVFMRRELRSGTGSR